MCEHMTETMASNGMRTEERGCGKIAVVRVGSNGQWHLCETCAALPEYKRYKNRAPISQASPILLAIAKVRSDWQKA